MTVLLFIGVVILTTIVVSFVYSYAINYEIRRRAQKDEYDRRYIQIQERIDSSLKSQESFDLIMRQIECLGRLPGRNKEMNEILLMHCVNHFEEIVRYEFVEECRRLNT